MNWKSEYTEFIGERLKSLGYSLDNPKQLASAVKKMSDYYIENPEAKTPWSEKWCMAAQLCYYLVLNWNRSIKVLERLSNVGFFEDIDTAIDWGAGLGALTLPLRESVNIKGAVEVDQCASNELSQLCPGVEIRESLSKFPKRSRSLLTFSYSLTEMTALPRETSQFENLLIIEPSTSKDARRLMQMRQDLMGKGYYPWAPCTHMESCPLLMNSKKDWCHDRTEVNAPAWFWRIDEQLPFKNRNVSFSYLAMSQRKPSHTESRLVGDLLDEKGKYRIAICRSQKREFLSWQKKHIKEAPNLYRGDKFQIPNDHEEKGNELRLK